MHAFQQDRLSIDLPGERIKCNLGATFLSVGYQSVTPSTIIPFGSIRRIPSMLTSI